MKKAAVLFTLIALLVVMLSAVTVSAVDYESAIGAEYTPVVDSAFTFAFVGDTQKVASMARKRMVELYDWLVEVKEEENLKFVAGLGDITDFDTEPEWEASMEAVKRLNGVVPYSLIRGNHDGSYQFIHYVNYEAYTDQVSGMYNKVLNTYHTLTIGTLNYLFLNLDHGPSDDVLEWACGVVEQHPEHNVIITTHGYIDGDGKFLEAPDTMAPTLTTGFNDAPAIWDGLVRKYENIVMVVCGHIGTRPEIVNYEAVGDHGNIVQHVLVNPQRVDKYEVVTGCVALFHFSEDGKTVQVENYATLLDTHYGPGLVFELESVGGNANETPINWPLVIGCVSAAAVVVAAVAVILIVERRKKAVTG